MADPVIILFANVTVTIGGVSAVVSNTPTPSSVEVNYTNNTVLSGSIHGTVAGLPFVASGFTLTGSGPYTLTATSVTVGGVPVPGLTAAFTYSSQTPTSFTSAVVAEFGVPLGGGSVVPNPNILTSTVVCFAAGTLIRTPRGDIAIETLTAGDLVVTASGEMRPIRWVGHRVMNCRSDSRPSAVMPVRIAADAFGPGRPSQDLLVSPAHSICVDLCGEVLIPAAFLVNGASIAQVEVDEIDYWHVELDSHDILVANNLAAESYIEMGNRGFFAGADGAFADYATGMRTHADFCRPVALDGALVDFARQRLLALAEASGWTRSQDVNLRLLVDGEAHRPEIEGDTSVFRFPAEAKDVRLQADTFIPLDVGINDARRLGAKLLGLTVSGGAGEPLRTIALDDPRIHDGIHDGEGASGAAWRWTKGEVALSPEFFAGLAGEVALRVRHDSDATRKWIAPARPERRSALRLVAAE